MTRRKTSIHWILIVCIESVNKIESAGDGSIEEGEDLTSTTETSIVKSNVAVAKQVIECQISKMGIKRGKISKVLL